MWAKENDANAPAAAELNAGVGWPKRMNILGCGKAARTLARVWRISGHIEIGGILNRSISSAREAAEFIGQGSPVSRLRDLPEAELLLIGTPDDQIAAACAQAAQEGGLRPGMSVFHLSGALSSEELAAARSCGAFVASFHPIRSFADPEQAARSLQGSFCTVEGEPKACELLGLLGQASGCKVLELSPQQKSLYHAGLVVVCNYLTALLEAGLRCLEAAGLPRHHAMIITQPLIRETLENVFRLGTVAALTGPIARGDTRLVTLHLKAIGEKVPEIIPLYQAAGKIAVQLAQQQGRAPRETLEKIMTLLEQP